MNEIARYFPSDMQFNLGNPRIVFTEHLNGQICMYEDVAPIIQRNKELEPLNKFLLEDLQRLDEKCKALDIALKTHVEYYKQVISDGSKRIAELEAELSRQREQKPVAYKLPVYPVRIVEHSDLNGCYADGTVESLYAEPKPAQIPVELVEWANGSGTYFDEENEYKWGHDKARAFVKSQLDKMGCKS